MLRNSRLRRVIWLAVLAVAAFYPSTSSLCFGFQEESTGKEALANFGQTQEESAEEPPITSSSEAPPGTEEAPMKVDFGPIEGGKTRSAKGSKYDKSNDFQIPFGGFGTPGMASPFAGPNVTFEAEFNLQKGGDRGRLTVSAEIAPTWHLYSTTQPAGGPQRTVIKVEGGNVELTGPLAADHQPKVSEIEFWPGVPVEEFEDRVSWSAPFVIKEQNDAPEKLKVTVSIEGQVCKTDGACVPVEEKISAKFAGFYESKTTSELSVPRTHATWTASVQPAAVAPGGKAILKISMKPEAGYHVYPYVPGDATSEYRTLIVVNKKSGLKFGTPVTDAETDSVDLVGEKIEYYKADVEWQIPIEIPESASPGERLIEAQVAFFTCNDRSCDPPAGLKINGTINVEEKPADDMKATGLNLSAVSYKSVLEQPQLADWIDKEEEPFSYTAGNGLEWWMIGGALLGGFILNFMPCVLPVIGLKLLSFVEQSGSSRLKVISLNLAYVAGIIAVLLVLAFFNVLAKRAGDTFGWGQQFTNLEFQVGMAVLMFVMALSFLGVWEIPIPGFANSGKSGQMMEKEGLTGAFLKGVLTTILATPCSGPFLGTLFGLTLSLSVPAIISLYVLVGVGLGMPYLVMCVFPGVVKLLPKPGAWMETLKEALAFPLLLTVVYFVAMISPDYRVATLIFLIFAWFGCWLIGRVPPYAEINKRVIAWSSGIAAATLGAIIGFSAFGKAKYDLDWVPYNEAALQAYREEGKTVMVEFTARWCATCQTNMALAIDRPKVADLVEENEVVPLLADWSEPNPEIQNKLKELDSISIPLLAIYPADPDAEPIVLRDAITQSQLLEALKEAGPSRGAKTSENEETASQSSEGKTKLTSID